MFLRAVGRQTPPAYPADSSASRNDDEMSTGLNLPGRWGRRQPAGVSPAQAGSQKTPYPKPAALLLPGRSAPPGGGVRAAVPAGGSSGRRRGGVKSPKAERHYSRNRRQLTGAAFSFYAIGVLKRRVPVAQRTERLPSKQMVAGSNPAWDAIFPASSFPAASYPQHPAAAAAAGRG